MKIEEITKIGIGRTYQSSLHFIEERITRFSDCKLFNRKVWCLKDPSVPICTEGKIKQRTYCDSGTFHCIYCKIAAQSDQPGQKFCKFQGNINQQSGQSGAGRLSSQKGSWPKNRGKLKYPIAMTGCGSKSFHRYIISSSQTSIMALFTIIFLNQ